MRSLIIILMLLVSVSALAAPIATFKFDNEQQEVLFHKLSQELRCLVCQNNSIGDSNADLAKDLRTELYNMIMQGKGEQEIIDFMVQRYGDFVLYNPPMKPLTWVLWFGPAIIFVFALFYVLRLIKTQRADTGSVELESKESERLKSLQAEAEQSNRQQQE
jgi:cytochrome c-type biogenesis protein CcmH